MRTPTNHEDNFMWREAAHVSQRAIKRQQEMNALVNLHLDRIRLALREDFGLTEAEIADYLKQCLQ